MLAIPLTPVPNQSISFNADGAYWQVRVYQAISHMYADISRNGVKLMDGVRCFGGIALMPYSYMHTPNFGNLIFDEDADWTNFASSCNLYYLSAAEFAEFQASSLLSVTV